MPVAVAPIRVNFGCGDTRLDGFVGVDVRPSRAADYVLPAWDTSPFELDSVAEIYSRHMLEHLDPAQAYRALAAWLDILEPGGRLRLIVPDLEFHARQLLGQQVSWSVDSARNIEHAMAGFYGWREPRRGGALEDAHRWGYTWETLTTLLREVGYTRIQHVCNGIDSEPWHLHVTALKPIQES
ncbi:MAG: hypothetical protein ABIG44_07990 [Planctomycetota bacterium]